MTLLKDFLREGTAALEHLYPAGEARSVVMTLCEDLLGTKSYTHIVDPGYAIEGPKETLMQESLRRLVAGEPVQYVSGKASFCGRTFRVDPSVLIPRPETEQLCREAEKIGRVFQRLRMPYGHNAKPVRVLDLCCGSGCITWTMSLSVPGARVVGVDISEAALAVAVGQDFSKEVKEVSAIAPSFVRADVLDSGADLGGEEFDLILSNPPYVLESEKAGMRKNVLDFEPALALFVPDEDPLVFHRAIAEHSKRIISREGVGITEVNEGFAVEVQALMRDAGFKETEILKDIFGKNRFVLYKK